MNEDEILRLIHILEKAMGEFNTWSVDGYEAHLLCEEGLNILKGQLK